MPLADIPVVYVIGAPRSGTTWLQLMLGSHPQIATPVELDLFSGFVAPWYESWREHVEADGRPARPYWGLPAALTEEQFEEAVRVVVERVYRSVLAAKRGAVVVVEKDPRYWRYVDVIRRTVPRAKFIHVLRDGRDVACSMVRVSRSWGRDWAPGEVAGAAQLWYDCVRGALLAQDAPGGYTAIRYECLLTNAGPDLLCRALTLCGVADELSLAESLYQRYAYPHRTKEEVLSGGLTWTGEAVRAGVDTSFPEDFIGPGTAGRWKTELDDEARRSFDAVAGDLLIELQYELDHSWAGTQSWTPLPPRGSN